jgi:hypothetical protein
MNMKIPLSDNVGHIHIPITNAIVQFIAILYSLSPPNYNPPVHVNTSHCLKFNEHYRQMPI